jgi:excisionase family DNA binding protein
MPKIAVDTGEVYDAAEAARLIGIGYATLYRWIKAGKLISIKLAGRTLIPKTEVERLQKKKDSHE